MLQLRSRSNSKKTHNIVGNCKTMCPQNEIDEREREGLLHRFETEAFLTKSQDESKCYFVVNPQYNQKTNKSKSNCRFKLLPKANQSGTIKIFLRSAAGIDKIDPNTLRPLKSLHQTVNYLVSFIFEIKDEPFKTVYDFIFDRFRAVRQDLVIQRLNGVEAIPIMETMIDFYIISGFRLNNMDDPDFNSSFNNKHLLEVLLRLLKIYRMHNYSSQSRLLYESLNLVLRPNDPEFDSSNDSDFLKWTSNCEVYRISRKLRSEFQENNFVAYFKTLKRLPELIVASQCQIIRDIRGKAFSRLSRAYGTQTCKFPVSKIQTLLAYPSIDAVKNDLKSLNIPITCQDTMSFIIFERNAFFSHEQLMKISMELDRDEWDFNQLKISIYDPAL